MKTEDIKKLLSLAEYARQYNPKTKKFNGCTYLQAIDMGISADVLKWAKNHHYISVNGNRDIWFAFKNPRHPNCTLDVLDNLVKIHEMRGDETWQL